LTPCCRRLYVEAGRCMPQRVNVRCHRELR
jgi:hypothetical protein